MSDETLPSGEALKAAARAREAKRGNKYAAANRAKEREFVRDSEMTADEHATVQPRLKREMLARNPRLLGTS